MLRPSSFGVWTVSIAPPPLVTDSTSLGPSLNEVFKMLVLFGTHIPPFPLVSGTMSPSLYFSLVLAITSLCVDVVSVLPPNRASSFLLPPLAPEYGRGIERRRQTAKVPKNERRSSLHNKVRPPRARLIDDGPNLGVGVPQDLEDFSRA